MEQHRMADVAKGLIEPNPGPVEPEIDPEKAPLYAPRKKIHPKTIWGPFRKFKWAALMALLAIYYIAPWIRWDRGPHAPDQAFLIDMPNRRGYFLWVEIWPQEVYYLAGLLIMGAVGLFFATALFGRVWCGFACPQTVWTDLYMWVERRIEGDRGARIRLDKAKWSLEKLWKRTAKHIAWIVIAFLTGGAWAMYFNDAPTLISDLFSLSLTGNQLFFIGLFTLTTYLLAGYSREQVCTYMCPWPRFQASMQDEDTMIVTYERWRGEPRAKPAKDGNYEDRGHCIDCGQCVVVCPTGIDIRDGNQLECIGCALCVDACNDVMDKVGLPRDLISYDSVNRQNARAMGNPVKRRFFRPRTFVYLFVLTLAAGIFFTALATRSHLDVNVINDRNPIYVVLKDGSIRNGFTLRILNKTLLEKLFELQVVGLPGHTLALQGEDFGDGPVLIGADPDSVRTVKAFVAIPPELLAEGETIDFQFKLINKITFRETEFDAIFRGPNQ
jgi:cytochrome c oxidase accessory protein FixG